jgi:hypothetical protein
MRARTFPSREVLDQADANLMAEVARLSSEPKPFAQLDAKYRAGRTLVFAMVAHRTNDAGTALLLSLDGYWDHAKWFPKSKLEIRRSRIEERFLVVTMPGWLANEKELPAQNVRPRLTPLISWTDEQQAEWRRITGERIRINDAVQKQHHRYRKPPQRMRFGETA